MRVYLVQHGEAVPKAEDPQRPLTEKGAATVRRIGDFLYRCTRLVVPEIVHSGKLRAAETAEILARCLNAAYNSAPGLAPNDDPHVWQGRLQEREKDVMLVGHLPHLDRLASLLLAGDAERSFVVFRNAGVLCLLREEGLWRLEWLLTPSLLECYEER